MALPELVRRSAEQEVGRYCDSRVPEELQDQLRVEFHTRGNAITICETRPPWSDEDPDRSWTHGKIAQLRYANGDWVLYWSDRNGKWHVYDLIEPSPTVGSLIAEVEKDPVSIFWG